MSKNKEQYIGPYKVFALVKIDDYKTPSGGEVIKVLFENKPFQIMSQKSFDSFVSDEPIEPTLYRDKITEEISTEIIKTIMEYNLSYADLTYALKIASSRMIDGYERAINALWTGDDSQWTSGIPYVDTRSIMEADMIQKSKNPFKNEQTESKDNA